MIVWAAIVATALALAFVFVWLGFPAPWLLGPMFAGLAFGCSPLATPRVPKIPFNCAQAVVGIVIAGAIRPELLGALASHWWLMLLVLAATIGIAMSAAWLLAASGTLPAATAVLGMMPGGAAVMSGLAVELDIDARIVAFMQYLRITLVLSTVTFVAHYIFRIEWHAPPSVAASVPLQTVAISLAVAGAAAAVAWVARIPGAPMMGPLLFGAALNLAGVIHVGLPAWLLDVSYVTMGLFIGLRFTIHSVLDIVRIMPRLIAANVGIIAACAVVGGVLVGALHIDPLTAYLATSPGGIDTMTIIALGGGGDVATIVALQATRSFIVVPFGPWLTRAVARRQQRAPAL